MSILIYSNAIHSGKTQNIFAWCVRQANAAGILMPVVNNKRCFYNVASRKYFLAENECLSQAETWKIGKYNFSRRAFNVANQVIEQGIRENYDYVVIDELGFLELDKKGFYRSWQLALLAIENQQFTNQLILVIRDNLLSNFARSMNNFDVTVVENWV